MTQRAFRPNWDVNGTAAGGFMQPPFGQPHDDEFAPFFANPTPGFNPQPAMNQPTFPGYPPAQNMNGGMPPYMLQQPRPHEMNGYYQQNPYANPMKMMPAPHPGQFHPQMGFAPPRPQMFDPYSGQPMDSRFLSSTENIPPHNQLNYMPRQFPRHPAPPGHQNGHFPDVGQWNAGPPMGGAGDNVWRDPDELRRKQEKLNGTQCWGNPDKQKNVKISRWTDYEGESAGGEFKSETAEKDAFAPSNPFATDLVAGSEAIGEVGWGDVDPLDKEKLSKIWVPHPGEMHNPRLSPVEPNHHHPMQQRAPPAANPPMHPPTGPNMWGNPAGMDFGNGAPPAELPYNGGGGGGGSGAHPPAVTQPSAYQPWQRPEHSPIQSPRLPNFDDSENFTSIPDLGLNVEHLLQEDRLDSMMKNVKI